MVIETTFARDPCFALTLAPTEVGGVRSGRGYPSAPCPNPWSECLERARVAGEVVSITIVTQIEVLRGRYDAVFKPRMALDFSVLRRF